tara:strand:+ start:45865 stop:46287 length:423 start_codon:yes stop_codon:yes gene_type:complete
MPFQKQIPFLLLTLFSISNSFTQELKEHLWKQRVLLVTSSDSLLLKKQVAILLKELPGLTERKLIVYKVTPKMYFKGIKNNDSASLPSNYSQIKKTSESFEIILIGLDGSVKLRETKTLKPEKLFTLIDGMSIRRQELRN